MDSKVLSQEQLKELVRFIHSRGFREPAVVLEILDHFACKVEELLAAKPGMQFYQAMVEAHMSFGVRGFYPFSENFYQQTKKKYKKLFWRNFKSIVSKPVSILSLPVIGYFVFDLYLRASASLHFRIWETWNIVDVTFFILLLLCPLLDLYLMLRLPKKDRRHPFVTSSLMNGSVSGLTLNILLTNIMREKNFEHPWIIGTILAVYIMYILPRHMAVKKTMEKAKDDLARLKQMTIDV